ncbi:hypothetical protein ACH42_04930 [Endozoicomonas sp. (ex Bugula neritina AB1)]|nr:hypothetical protein ACH42_04930 [Endozoicomonas sp. (ex Bugula neritina AB1)]
MPISGDLRKHTPVESPPPYSASDPLKASSKKQTSAESLSHGRKVRKTAAVRFLENLVQWVPGFSLAFRVVQIIKNFRDPKLSSPDRLKKGEYWQIKSLPSDPLQQKAIAIDSALSQLSYDMKWSRVTEAENIHHSPPIFDNYSIADMNSFEDIVASQDPLFKNMRISSEGMLFDSRTGLTALLIKNKFSDELTL